MYTETPRQELIVESQVSPNPALTAMKHAEGMSVEFDVTQKGVDQWAVALVSGERFDLQNLIEESGYEVANA